MFCIWCGSKFSRKVKKTREHVVPRSRGGRGSKNIRAACIRCNNSRGNSSNWVKFDNIPPEFQVRGKPMILEEGEYKFANITYNNKFKTKAIYRKQKVLHILSKVQGKQKDGAV